MRSDKCPKCGENFPEHHSWSGGWDWEYSYIKIGCKCRKCGYSWVAESKFKRVKRQDYA